jgi:hypothetical protein
VLGLKWGPINGGSVLGKARAQTMGLKWGPINGGSVEGKARAQAMGQKWGGSVEGKARAQAMGQKWGGSVEGKARAKAMRLKNRRSDKVIKDKNGNYKMEHVPKKKSKVVTKKTKIYKW